MSPTTICSAGNCTIVPSRSALTCCGSSFCKAARVCSMRYSCQNENTPLISITAMTA